jgi:hypothetical protein
MTAKHVILSPEVSGRRISGLETMKKEILRYAQDDKCYAQDDKCYAQDDKGYAQDDGVKGQSKCSLPKV